MEHDEGLVFDRPDHGVDVGLERIKPGRDLGSILAVFGRIVRVGFCQCFRDLGDDYTGILRVQPEMRIEGSVSMVIVPGMIVMLFIVVVGMFRMIMIVMIIMLCVIMVVVIIVLCMIMVVMIFVLCVIMVVVIIVFCVIMVVMIIMLCVIMVVMIFVFCMIMVVMIFVFCMIIVVMIVMLSVIVVFMLFIIVIGMVIMLLMIMIVVTSMPFMVAMIVSIKRSAFTNRQLDQIVGIFQFDDRGFSADVGDRSLQKRLKTRADPDDYIRLLQIAGFRWTEAVSVRGCSTIDDDTWCRNAIHHTRNKGMKWFDGHNNIGVGNGARTGKENRGRRKQRRSMVEHGNTPIDQHVITLRWRNAITCGPRCRKWRLLRFTKKAADWISGLSLTIFPCRDPSKPVSF